MKKKILKISMIIAMIITMTMANFIFVGKSLISYAVDEIATNHNNVEFKAYFKNEKGEEVRALEKMPNEEETFVYLQVNVKKEGYFNGEISLENSNFTLKETDSAYVNKIENNTIYLNQINVGTVEEIKVKIEPMKEENFSIGLLNIVSEMKLEGIYRDNTQKDIKIQATRELELKMIENNTPENVQNEIEVITNKAIEIEGEEKRLIQLSYHMGLKENNYPIKEIYAKLEIPEGAEIEKVEYLNNMTKVEENHEKNNVEITLKNEATSEGTINWKKQGEENIILTCIYDKEVELKDMPIKAYQKVKLYDNKEIEAQKQITIGEDELNGTMQIQAKNVEDSIYKGKLKARIDRQYQSITQINVNYAKELKSIELSEEESKYIVEDNEEEAKVTYSRTTLKKEQFDKLFGQNGVLTIYDQNGEVVASVTDGTTMDEEGNIVINYDGKEVTKIQIKTTETIEEGTLELKHIKTIKTQDEDIEKIEKASEIKNNIVLGDKNVETTLKLEDTQTKATIELNKESLSTVIRNNMEIKEVLTTNNEQYALYKEPEISIELPEQIENIEINSIDLLYENELKIKEYAVDGRNINVKLEGEQTQYKEEAIEGATIVINTTIDVNRKAATKDEEVKMTYANNEVTNSETKAIKIVAPTDITAIYGMQDLGIETLGQEENKQVIIKRGEDEKQVEAQIEVINNNQDAVENIKILGEFPTDHGNNNMGITVEGIEVQDIEDAKIYYTENIEATDDIENEGNAWTDSLTDSSKVSKYLIVVNKLETGNSVKANYKYTIPKNLEYNQDAKTGYKVKYTNSNTKVESEIASTNIEMKTGIGPKVEVKLTTTSEGRQVKNGEVIKYKIEVANVGTEDVQDIKVSAKVPEGTTMVEPKENYEYTGASYYKELDNEKYEATIQSLKMGQIINAEYEVRVNSDVKEGTTLSNMAEIKYGDVTKATEEIKNTTVKGNLRVSVKRITDREVKLYEGGVIRYFAIVENISEQKQDNIKIQTEFSEGLEISQLTLYTGLEENDEVVENENTNVEDLENVVYDQNEKEKEIESKLLQYADEIDIGSLEAGENKVLCYDLQINKKNDNGISFAVKVKNGQDEYKSNTWQDKVSKVEVAISMTAEAQSQNLKAGDTIKYVILLENKTDAEEQTAINVKDAIPAQLTIKSIKQNGKEIEKTQGNDILVQTRTSQNETTTIEIEAVVNHSEDRDRAEAITNVAYAESSGEKIATTSEITHILKANDSIGGSNGENNENGENGENGEGEETPSGNDVATGKNMVTGLAWFDENANGQKDNGEKVLSNITVKLLNTETNNLVKEEDGEILEAITNENGIYVLDKIKNGKYIVIFDYDNTQYALTKYKVNGVAEAENSNAVLGELTIENEKQKVASTDIIEIQDNNISNINIGLIKLENFDLKLDKYVNKILIQNSKGTTVREYDNATMAKVELDAKTIKGSTVIIEYKINVTNNGQIDGYAKKIADYAVSDLKFSSELNKDWYQVGNILYTNVLANEKIQPGETKAVTLTLTKTMTEDNTGSIPNIAEIAEDYNELGIEDSNSTPGNRSTGENDLGTAEVILSIRTGGIIYATIGIAVVAVLGITAVVIIKKRKKQDIE